MSSSLMTFGIPVGIAVLAAATIGGAVYFMNSGSSSTIKETKEEVYEANRPRNASVVGALPVESADNTTAISLGGRRRKTRKLKSKRRRTKKNRKH